MLNNLLPRQRFYIVVNGKNTPVEFSSYIGEATLRTLHEEIGPKPVEDMVIVEALVPKNIPGNHMIFHAKDLIPIPLSEIDLLAFHFTLTADGWIRDQIMIKRVGESLKVFIGAIEMKNTGYFHELQNLYFYLEGRELTF